MKFLSLLFVILLLTLTGTTCKNSPTEPEKPSEPDTTSQNFTFETKEFGDGFSSSYFNDVWLFSENNIWAVGYISQNQFQGNCNIMRWNGTEWKYINSNGISTSSGLTGIWALDSTHIYFANNSVGELKNGVYKSYVIPGNWIQGQAVTKLWGSSESNIWGVGPWGTVVHYDGVSWKKIDIETKWNIFQINGQKSSPKAFALANSADFGLGLLKLENNTVTVLAQHIEYETGFSNDLYVKDDKEIILASGFGVYSYNLNSNELKPIYYLADGPGLETIGFASPNDIFYQGFMRNGEEWLIHFNGIRYKQFKLPNNLSYLTGYADSKNGVAIFTGFRNNKAFMHIIRRKK